MIHTANSWAALWTVAFLHRSPALRDAVDVTWIENKNDDNLNTAVIEEWEKEEFRTVV